MVDLLKLTAHCIPVLAWRRDCGGDKCLNVDFAGVKVFANAWVDGHVSWSFYVGEQEVMDFELDMPSQTMAMAEAEKHVRKVFAVFAGKVHTALQEAFDEIEPPSID